jgi:hypothetical protein
MRRPSAAFLPSLFVLNGLLPGCGPGVPPEIPETPVAAADTLEWSPRQVERSSADCEEEEAACTTVAFDYPHFEDPTAGPAEGWIHRALTAWDDPDGPRVSSPVGWADAFVEQYEAYRKEVSMPVAGWFVERRIDVARNDTRILALELFDSRYTGGAHPLTIHRYFHLDRGSGQAISSLEAVLRPEGTDVLLALAEAQFRDDRGLDADAPLSDAGVWDARLPLPDTFLLGGDGLLLLYNVYEIAPYAVGPIEILLPWDAVRGLLEDPEWVVPG